MNKGTAKKFIIEKKGNKNVNWMGHTFHLFYDLKKKKKKKENQHIIKEKKFESLVKAWIITHIGMDMSGSIIHFEVITIYIQILIYSLYYLCKLRQVMDFLRILFSSFFHNVLWKLNKS